MHIDIQIHWFIYLVHPWMTFTRWESASGSRSSSRRWPNNWTQRKTSESVTPPLHLYTHSERQFCTDRTKLELNRNTLRPLCHLAIPVCMLERSRVVSKHFKLKTHRLMVSFLPLGPDSTLVWPTLRQASKLSWIMLNLSTKSLCKRMMPWNVFESWIDYLQILWTSSTSRLFRGRGNEAPAKAPDHGEFWCEMVITSTLQHTTASIRKENGHQTIMCFWDQYWRMRPGSMKHDFVKVWHTSGDCASVTFQTVSFRLWHPWIERRGQERVRVWQDIVRVRVIPKYYTRYYTSQLFHQCFTSAAEFPDGRSPTAHGEAVAQQGAGLGEEYLIRWRTMGNCAETMANL